MAEHSHHRGQWLEWLALLLLTSMAAGLRFYHLDQIPPGFHHDEAFEAVEALKILAGGYYPLFFPGNFGVDPMFIYMTALAFRLFGAEPVVMRGVAALVGTLTIPALYWLGKELESNAERPLPGLGIASAAMLACLYWHVTFSRVGIEPVLVPLAAILIFASLWRGLRTRGWGTFAASGFFLGLSPYTYPAARLLPVLVALFIIYGRVVRPTLWRGLGRHLLVLAAVAGLTFAPLGITFARHPDLLTLRTRQVAVFAEGAGSEHASASVLKNTWDTLLGISVRGDSDPRSNLPGRPLLDPFLSFLFYLGAVIAFRYWREPVYGFMLLWITCMLAPTVLSEYAPHFRRAIGAAPAFALLVGLAVSSMSESIGHLIRRFGDSRPVLLRVAWIACVALGLLGYASSIGLAVRDYFVRWGRMPELFYAYDVGLLALGQKIAEAPAGSRAYISPRTPEHPTLAFALWNREHPLSFDGRHCIRIPPPDESATYWIITHEDWRSEKVFPQLFLSAQEGDTLADWQGREYARSWYQPAGGEMQLTYQRTSTARFGPAIGFEGWSIINPDARAGDILYMDFFWKALHPPASSYTFFVHLLGPYNPATAGPVWAGADSRPGLGSCPTDLWRAGERIFDEVQVSLPRDMPAGAYDVEIGWYLLDTLERLPAFDERGQPLGDRLILGTLSIESPSQ